MQKCFTDGVSDENGWVSTAADDVQGVKSNGVPISLRNVNVTEPQWKVEAEGQCVSFRRGV